jgi:hypothetical protein
MGIWAAGGREIGLSLSLHSSPATAKGPGPILTLGQVGLGLIRLRPDFPPPIGPELIAEGNPSPQCPGRGIMRVREAETCLGSRTCHPPESRESELGPSEARGCSSGSVPLHSELTLSLPSSRAIRTRCLSFVTSASASSSTSGVVTDMSSSTPGTKSTDVPTASQHSQGGESRRG